MGRVAGKVAFITGAGQGQGRSHAMTLAREGADIIATDLCEPYPARVRYRSASKDDLEETKRLVEAEGRRCVTAVADVRHLGVLGDAVRLGVAELGRLDIVIGNAGVITFHEESIGIEEETFDLVVDTNLKGAWNTVLATAPVLKEQRRGGSIVLTSSSAGLRGQTHYAHYAAAKTGVVGMMRSFANELGEYGIRVNTIHPTGVSSPGMGQSTDVSELYDSSRYFPLAGLNVLPDLDSGPSGEFTPVPRLTEQEISKAVLFLASDDARYITGAALPVDAGNTNTP